MLAVVVFQCGNPRFLSHANLMNVLQQSVYLALTALAQMLVLISGGFDLSVGANIALTSIVSASAMVAFEGAYPSLGLAAVLVGTAATVGSGSFWILQCAWRPAASVNPFVVTLATASIFQGLTLIVSQGLQVPEISPTYSSLGIGSSSILGLPVSVALTIPVAIAAYVLTGWTRCGRYLYAVGSQSARRQCRWRVHSADADRYLCARRPDFVFRWFLADRPRVVRRAAAGPNRAPPSGP